jgi:DNA polymerase elongation subunit (family B)
MDLAPPLEPPLYGLDIETDTSVDGLDPAIGGVLAAAVAGPGGPVVFDHGDEAQLLRQLDQHLGRLEPGVLVTWNGGRFDLPYLASRAARLGVRLRLRLRLDPALGCRHEPLPGHDGAYRATWDSHAHLDVYRVYRADVAPALRMPCSLKAVARLVGLRPIEVDASRVHELSPADRSAYVSSDAVCTAALARRRWATARAWIDPSEPNRPRP